MADGEPQFDLELFDRITANLGYTTDAQRQRALGLSHGVMNKIRSGKTQPGRKFIARMVKLGIAYDIVFPARAKQDA